MERLVKKYQQKYKRVRDQMDTWEDLNSRLLSQFGNASSIIERMQEVLEPDPSRLEDQCCASESLVLVTERLA